MNNAAYQTIDSTLQKLKGIDTIPKHWENTEPPNEVAKANAERYLKLIWEKHKILPYVVAATIESGVFIQFRDYEGARGTKHLVIETYNDGESGGIVTVSKQPSTLNKDFTSDQDLLTLVEEYLKIVS
jgi:hypothetical protein